MDVLTLSATPIPRTLNMSLVGLRDMSVIETPPKDRLAIQTVVAPFSETLIRRAIEEEMDRGTGRFFWCTTASNRSTRWRTWFKSWSRRRAWSSGHGQMNEKELESVMLKFVRDEADVLVSTTIVENGLDIPRANTILINRADRFGFPNCISCAAAWAARTSAPMPICWFLKMFRSRRWPRARLAALKEFSDLGAGFRVAALDLELRGAGNLLGGQQHGHINAIGFDLYLQMLERAVATLKGEEVKPEMRATINLGLDIRIPQEYIPNENLRLRTYKRIAGIAGEAEREEVNSELTDRFGPPPPAVGNLLDYALLKGLAERVLISSIETARQRSGHQISSRDSPVAGKPGEIYPLAEGRLAPGPQRHAVDAPGSPRTRRGKRQKRVASAGNEAIN